jgi:CelD/BcsL family acetyltransferase involved in cellulose biosynthesis
MEMQVRVLTTYDDFLKLRAPWEELHRTVKGTLFQHPEWLTVWWVVYGAARDLRVRSFWNDGLLVALIPAFTDIKEWAHLKFRRSSFLGEAEAHGEYFPLVESSCLREVARDAALDFVNDLRNGSVDVLDFHGFPPESPFMQAFLGGLREGVALRYNPESYPHMVTEGPADGEAYFRSLSPGRRRGLRRDRKGLADAGAEIEIVTDWCGGRPFEDLAQLHTRRWNHIGQPGRLSREKFARFLPNVTERLMATGNARIYFVRVNGTRVAGSLVFNMYRQHYGYMNGRDPAHALMKYSVGDVLSLRLMMDAFDQGCDCFDLMGGDYQYKQFTGTTKRWYARATAIARGSRGLKARMYLEGLRVRDALNELKSIRTHERRKRDSAKE